MRKIEIEKRREKVKKLYDKMTQSEIARKLGVNLSTITRDIKYLKAQEGIKKGKRKRKKKIEKQRTEKVKKLYEKGEMTQSEIAAELQISEGTISKDIKYLKEQGEIEKGRIEQRREEVKELYKTGEMTQSEIARKLGISLSTIRRDIEYLKEQEEIENERIEQRREEVKKLYNEHKMTQSEIARKLHVSEGTISKDIKYLKEQGEIKNDRIEQRREEVKELYKTGEMTQSEIAIKLDVSLSTIAKDIEYLKEQEKIEIGKRKRGKHKTRKLNPIQIRKLCDDFCGEPKKKETLEKYILDCKDEFKEGTLKVENLPIIEEVATLIDNYKSCAFYLNVCIKFKKFQEAIKFINSQISNETFTDEQRNKIKELRKKMEEISKKNIAIGMLEKGEGVAKTVELLGLPEVDVIRLNNKLL